MKRSSLLVVLTSVALAGSVSCATGSVAAAGAAPSAAAQPVASHHLAGQAGHVLVPNRAFAATLAAQPHRSAVAQRRVAHLDPALNVIAGLVAPTAAAGSAVPVEKNGDVVVTVQGTAAAAAAGAAGGRVLGTAHGLTTIAVKPAGLTALAGHAGITSVRPSNRAMPQGSGSEGVTASGAQNWADNGNLGNGGAGVNIGIVDAGFGNLTSEITAGRFGAVGTVVYPRTGTGSQNHCADDSGTDHGTAVAEIVHQMAPQATLYLYCVVDNVTFADSANQIINAGNIKIVNSSLGFTAETRGDGLGGTGSTEQAVASAKAAGVLWIQSAGNSAEDHWSGTLVDANADTYIDLLDTGKYGNVDVTALDPQTGGNAVLTWDQWPTSNLALNLGVQEFDSADHPLGGINWTPDRAPNTPPVLQLDLTNNSTVPGDVHSYEVFVRVGAGTLPTPAVHYDLFYGGDVYPSYLSGQNPARAAAGSILEPATSPSAFAVGAANWRSDALEPFSSQGPTIDNRVKPDLLAFDGVSSFITDVQSGPGPSDPAQTGFYGTSSAAPHVAGAAALVLAANPTMTADDMKAYLQNRASPNASPATNLVGRGLLQLLDPATTSTCPARASLPAKVVISAPDVAYNVAVSTTCTHYVVSAALKTGTRVADNLFWQDTAATRTAHFIAASQPTGTYTTALNGGVADQGRIGWTSSSVTFKYGLQLYSASSRNRGAVFVNGLGKIYSAGGLIRPAGRVIYLQRFINGGWQNMLGRTVLANGTVTVGFMQSRVYQYRWVGLETATSWGAVSAGTIR